MKKKLSLLMVALVAVAAFAGLRRTSSEKTVTYALAEGDTFTSGQTVDVKDGEETVATITYGFSGDEAFKAAAAEATLAEKGFAAFTAGNGVNGTENAGTCYIITPKYAGSIEVAVVLNNNKPFFITEDGTALEGYNGIKVETKYYGTYSFQVKANSVYKVYCTGSKLGFYGFKYTYEVEEQGGGGEELIPVPDSDPVVLDFTDNTDWAIPTDKTVAEGTFTNGGYSVKIAGSEGDGYYFFTNKSVTPNYTCLMLGKSGAYLTLPAFDFAVSRIVVEGTSGASGKVTQNIFVGETAVSTATTGAKGTNTYVIDDAYKAAGKIYTLKVTNGNNTQISKVNIYPVTALEAPSISGEISFEESTTVTLSCGTDGAKIYYTTDGSDPTVESAEYTEPFTITATTTVKAMSVKSPYKSSIVEKTFYSRYVANIEALNALPNGISYIFTSEALVVAKPTPKYIYIKDETGSSLIYDENGADPEKTQTSTLEVGATITAHWTGSVKIYNKLFEAIPTGQISKKGDEVVPVIYPVVTLGDVKAENVNQVVTLKGVTYGVVDGKDFSIYLGDALAAGYNQFGIDIPAAVEGETYDIVGAIGRHNDNIQFWPISITRVPKVLPVTVEAEDITGGDITAALTAKTTAVTEAGDKVGNITINLAENGAYTVSASIEAGGNVTIAGPATLSEGQKAPVVDASALTTPFIQMSATPTVAANEQSAYPIDGITIKDVAINGLSQSLVDGKNAIYYMKGITIENSVINVSGSKHIIDFQGKGLAEVLSIKNSTLWASDAAKHTGRLYQQQSGKKPAEVGAAQLKVSITNSTLYNICNNQNYVGYYRENSKSYHSFEVLNSVIVNCATSGNFVKSLNQKQTGASSTWNVDGNIFNYGGADTSGDEVTNSASGVVKNSIAGVVTFTSTETPDFGGNVALSWGTEQPAIQPGDSRWTLTYSQKGIMEDGKYFVMGLSYADPQQWLAGGKLSDFGVEFTATFNAETLTYTLQNAEGKYLQSDLTFGETAFGWTIDNDPVLGQNIYTKDGDTKKYIGVNEEKNLVLTETYDATCGWGFFPADYFWAMLAPRVIIGSTELTGTAEAGIADIKNAMVLNETTGLWEKTFKLVEVTAEKQPNFKVALNGDAAKAYPAEPRAITLADFGAEAQPGIYNITITYNDEGNVIGVSGVKVEPEDIVINPSDLGAVYGVMNDALEIALDGKLAKSITFNLGEGISYSVTKSLVSPNNITINGAAGATIDASALTTPFIQMSATPTVAANEQSAYPIDGITIKDVAINGLSQSLVDGKNAIYYMKGITIENSVINVSGSKHIIDFQGKGLAEVLSIKNSTLWASDAAKHTGRLYQQQSGKKPAEVGAAQLKVSITNSTLYNICNNQNYVGYYRENSKSYHSFEVLNSVIVNCATSGNFVKSLNQKQTGASSTWNVDGNIFNYGGADTSSDEVTNSASGVVKNSIAGVITFTDAANGNFNGNVELPFGAEAPATQPGDTEWILTYTNAPQQFAITKTAPANGSYTVKAGDAEITEAAKDTEVTITATPDENFELDQIKVEGTSTDLEVIVTVVGNVGTFTMPAADVTVTVTFKNATGINSIAADKMKDATIYTIGGQRVNSAKKGLYIINGRKVVIK